MDTFGVMESIAKHQIKTLISDNTVFWDEVYKQKADSDGFTHDAKKGCNVSLMNGSFIATVSGTEKTVRGKRSNLNIYDEAGFISKGFFDVTEPFCTQSSDFKTGANYDAEVYPPEAPTTRMYVGSASDTNSQFYAKYKEGVKQMLAGNDKYFVADLSCEIPLHPTMNGKPYAALLSQDEIDRKMRENEIIALREYYNIFDRFDLEDSVITRSDIMDNEKMYLPSCSWGGKKHKYIIAYDPASKVDNSPILVTDIITREDGSIGGRFVHMENLIVTYRDGSKRPMTIEEQVQRIREMVWEYNGRENAAPYENVTLLLDAGMAGQAPAIAQMLCQDWVGKDGKKHPGLYDENSKDMQRWAESFPRAVKGSMWLIEPNKYRNMMFDAAHRLVPSGVIEFPPQCPKYDSLVTEDGLEKKLSKAEMASLIQMDLMKEEMVYMIRFKTQKGSITYGLPPEKARKMHDDRNYVAVMTILYIDRIRNEGLLGEVRSMDYSVFFSGDSTKEFNAKMEELSNTPEGQSWASLFGNPANAKKHNSSPFGGSNPFGRK